MLVLRSSEEGVPEVVPERLDAADRARVQAQLRDHGFACVRRCLSRQELEHAHDLLWNHLEGIEPASQRMTQQRPLRWRRGEPSTWQTGHGDGLMTSTTHCDSMWYVRSRPGVIRAFHAAYGTQRDSELVAAFDRMSVNLPTSSENAEALRVASTVSQHGKFGVSQSMHTHRGQFYGEGERSQAYYGIVPLFDMNRSTGATAVVPGSHRKVREVEERRLRKWGAAGEPQPSAAERLARAADVELFESCGLRPCVTNVRAGDCLLFETALYHGGYAAEDPTGHGGQGPNQLLRAVYILGMSLTRLQTPDMLAARREAYELDLLWPPNFAHADFARHILEYQEDPALGCTEPPSQGAREGTLEKALQLNLEHRGEPDQKLFPRIRSFSEASPEVRRLIDPTADS